MGKVEKREERKIENTKERVKGRGKRKEDGVRGRMGKKRNSKFAENKSRNIEILGVENKFTGDYGYGRVSGEKRGYST